MREKPAFPVHPEIRDDEPHAGMTLREYAAVKFMAAIIEADGIQYADQYAHEHARIAVINADALIDALSRPTGGSNHGE